jgi:hypothetical protein
LIVADGSVWIAALRNHPQEISLLTGTFCIEILYRKAPSLAA